MSRVLVALDVPSLGQAEALASDLLDVVDGFKVGMELLMASGPTAIESISSLGKPVFADAKLHDIPNTVERAAGRIRAAGARWVTAHAAGGEEMISAANSGMEGEGVLGVTMLTSLSAGDLAATLVDATPADYVAVMASLSSQAGAEGVICSPAEIATVRHRTPGMKVFTPGVRLRDESSDDQRRVDTPEKAAAKGADYLVIGRPITRAEHPAAKAREIVASVAGVTM